MNDSRQETALIAGGGPAGLTAAIELLEHTGITPVVCESSDMVGGLSRTVEHEGNRIDIGGHRFFSKSDRVTSWWHRMMPDMLTRRRVSRIYYRRHLFDYPVTLKWSTLSGLGLWQTLQAGMGYVKARCSRLPETTLENFYINRFGRPLYAMFFESYTQKVWGVHPSRLGADWGSQRVKGLSMTAVVADMIKRALGIRPRHVETSLIEQFDYPHHGPGELWERVAHQVAQRGGKVLTGNTVSEIHVAGRRVDHVVVVDAAGLRRVMPCDHLLSSMPVKDLVAALRDIEVPGNVAHAAATLPYRDFITVGLLVDELLLKNTTRLKTLNNRIPDTWIYIQEPNVKVGRLQVFNNWSPYMVADNEHTMWIGLEYFCDEGDDLWTMSDDEMVSLAIDEMVRMGIIANRTAVLTSCRIKMRKAYPAYMGGYRELPAVRAFLDRIENLWCIGRNGQHRYNNMDHSMLTAMLAVEAIAAGRTDKKAVWAVNTEDDYHEQR